MVVTLSLLVIEVVTAKLEAALRRFSERRWPPDSDFGEGEGDGGDIGTPAVTGETGDEGDDGKLEKVAGPLEGIPSGDGLGVTKAELESWVILGSRVWGNRQHETGEYMKHGKIRGWKH